MPASACGLGFQYNQGLIAHAFASRFIHSKIVYWAVIQMSICVLCCAMLQYRFPLISEPMLVRSCTPFELAMDIDDDMVQRAIKQCVFVDQ
eukprot:5441707-Pyramimonas_sp.AAC.1